MDSREGAKNTFFSDGSDANKLYVLVLNMCIYIYISKTQMTNCQSCKDLGNQKHGN